MNRYLYIMTFKDSFDFHYYKIGISNNVKKRKQSLQKDIDFELKVLYKKYLENTFDFETEIKKKYKCKNVKQYIFGKLKPRKKLLPNNTEWFHLDEKEVEQIKKSLDVYNFEIKKERQKPLGLGGYIDPYEDKTYTFKEYFRGKAYYQLSLKQYNYILDMLKNKNFKLKEIDFLKLCCNYFQVNKKLSQKQYDYIKYLATKNKLYETRR